VVLLIDDSPNPTDPATIAKLNETRAIAGRIQGALAEPRARFSEALVDFELSTIDGSAVELDDVRSLAEHYRWAAEWLHTMASQETIDDHVDVFFVEQVLIGLADDFSLMTKALLAAVAEGETTSIERMRELHRRLAWIFDVELDTFERKAFASLSHEANKAMNLNAYIGLMGGSYRQESTPAGEVLRRVEARPGADGPDAAHADQQIIDCVVPDSDFILTLDADSILVREYCLRLVYLLEQPENERVAVTQTPYSSFRGAGTRIERLAGATTDIQHILHQGMSYYGAAFWVGANAVIRKAALDDIVETEHVAVLRSNASSKTEPSSRTPSQASTSAPTVGESSTTPNASATVPPRPTLVRSSCNADAGQTAGSSSCPNFGVRCATVAPPENGCTWRRSSSEPTT
jgi:hypothetical protein